MDPSHRLNKNNMEEFSNINSANHEWVNVQLVDDEIFKWRAFLKGPEESPYAGGVFTIDIVFPKDYPFKPPRGDHSFGFLETGWNPQIKPIDVLGSIRDILITPEIPNAIEPEIAHQYVHDNEKFIETAADWTKKNAL